MRGHDCTFSSDTIIVNSPQLWTAFSWVWRPSPSYRAPHKTNSSDGATDERAGDLNKQKRIISLYTRAAKTNTILPKVLGPIGVWWWVFGSRSVFKVTQRCSAGIRPVKFFHTDSIIISLWFLSYTQRHCHDRIEKSPNCCYKTRSTQFPTISLYA